MKQRILSVILALCLCIPSPLVAHASPEDSLQQEDVLMEDISEESTEEPDASDEVIDAPEDSLSQQEDVFVEEPTEEPDAVDDVSVVPEEGISPQEIDSMEEDSEEEAISELAAQDGTDLTPAGVYEDMIALKDQDAYKEGTPWTDYEPYSDSKGYYKWKGGPLEGKNISAVGCVAFSFILSDAAFGSLPARMYGANQFRFEDIKVGDILRMNTDTHTVIVLEVNDTGVIVAEGNNSGKVHWGRAISREVVMRDTSHYITRYPEGYIPPDDPGSNESIGAGSLEGGLTWNLTKAGTLTISGKGAMPDFSSTEDQPWSDKSSQIRKVVIGEGITSIGSCAFWKCGVLSVEIPTSVTAIGNSAFRGSSIIYVSIPSSVKTIGDSSFRECQNLSSVTVSEGVETIVQNAFRSCTSLTSIDLPASIGEVGAGAFFQCTAMTSATFAPGSKQVKLGDNLFTQCYYLMSVALPTNIDRIGEGMFQNCQMLPGVEIPQGAESIGGSAFASCSGFTTVIIPDSVTTIGIAAFSNCPLKDIYFTGTEAQWNRISKIGDTVSAVSKATIHFNYTPDCSHEYETVITKEPTCTEDGTSYEECNLCKEKKEGSEKIIPAPGHQWSKWKTTTAATVSAPAEQTRICSVCNEKSTRNTGEKAKPTITLTANSLTLKVKQSTTAFKASGFAEGDSLKSVTSSDKKIVQVSNVSKKGTFKLTAQNKAGSAKLTIKLASGLKKTVKVTVQSSNVKTTAINGVEKNLSIVKGKTTTLKPVLVPVTSRDKITYQTSDPKVATVSSKGVVKGVKVGTAKITVKAGSKKVVCTVKVTGVKTTKITGVPLTANVKKGKQLTLKPKLTPSNSDDKITYTSSNNKVATVTSKGVVKGVKAGTATITVKSGSKKVTCKVTVKK